MPTPQWAAPTATGPVDAVVELPGSKSMTNRALVLAALAAEPTVIRRPLRSRDTLLMAAALRSLGTGLAAGDVAVAVAGAGDGASDGDGDGDGGGGGWTVTPGELHGPATVDCGLAGTVMRFVPPVAALAAGDVTVDGDPRARERPMKPLVTALRALGVEIEDGGRAALPFVVRGRGEVKG